MIAVGTSGWSYDDWRGAFYPRALPRSQWLGYYAQQFPTVEVNSCFYRLPSEGTVTRWHDQAPAGFRFAVKGSRFVTHQRRIAGAGDGVSRFVHRVAGLAERLGVALWQLPPTLERDADLLAGFVSILPGGARHAIEFRHPSWLVDDVFGILRDHGVALVWVSSVGMPAAAVETADFVYLRLHGLADGYAHDYSADELRPWLERLRDAHARGRDGYVYFNNDARARAPKNARELTEALGEASAPWPPPEP